MRASQSKGQRCDHIRNSKRASRIWTCVTGRTRPPVSIGWSEADSSRASAKGPGKVTSGLQLDVGRTRACGATLGNGRPGPGASLWLGNSRQRGQWRDSTSQALVPGATVL
ncbi:hypothetical protein L1887_56328 [Cichorium endivia]|nr:hypothetical protein L1887_56328 [Cichorium endivia]